MLSVPTHATLPAILCLGLKMQCVALSLDNGLLGGVDALIQLHGYQKRSEAVSDLVRGCHYHCQRAVYRGAVLYLPL